MKDRRQNQRRSGRRSASHQPCILRVDDSVRRGVITDYDTRGVRIHMLDRYELPERCSVFCLGLALNGEGRLMWQSGRAVGLRLL